MSLNLATLKVNDRVAIARFGGWNTHSEGIYVVKKVNKVRVVLGREMPVGRESENYERTFSTKTGVEKGSERYYSAFIETVADKEARDAANKARRDYDAAWEQVEAAAKRKDITKLRECMAALEVELKK